VTALAAISAIAAVLIGSVHMALAADNITKIINNKGVNVQTYTNQKQDCQTAGETSPISNSCTATSTDTVTQSGGVLKK
jgi:glucan phosphoethanolaminetransferase (alkaline phosphatase superfamily)